MTENEIIGMIESIRMSNNRLWMDILRVAMDKAPDKTKQILADIRSNDVKIAEMFHRMSEMTTP